jgi:hypothetical protein
MKAVVHLWSCWRQEQGWGVIISFVLKVPHEYLRGYLCKAGVHKQALYMYMLIYIYMHTYVCIWNIKKANLAGKPIWSLISMILTI